MPQRHHHVKYSNTCHDNMDVKGEIPIPRLWMVYYLSLYPCTLIGVTRRVRTPRETLKEPKSRSHPRRTHGSGEERRACRSREQYYRLEAGTTARPALPGNYRPTTGKALCWRSETTGLGPVLPVHSGLHAQPGNIPLYLIPSHLPFGLAYIYLAPPSDLG